MSTLSKKRAYEKVRQEAAQRSLSHPDKMSCMIRTTKCVKKETPMQTNRKRLWRLLNERALIIKPGMALSAGSVSTFYFDCKKVTLNGKSLALLADILLEEIDRFPERPSTIGGLTLGADPIAAAVAMRAFQIGHPTIHGSIVRKEPKKHGTHSYIENEMPAGTKVVIVDDVITTGSSTARACDQLLENGYEIVGILALVDREVGGSTNLEKKYGCAVRSIFKTSDFPKAAITY